MGPSPSFYLRTSYFLGGTFAALRRGIFLAGGGTSFSEGYSDMANLLPPPIGTSSKLLDGGGVIVC